MVEDASSNQKKVKTGILLFLIFASTNAKPYLIENIKVRRINCWICLKGIFVQVMHIIRDYLQCSISRQPVPILT